ELRAEEGEPQAPVELPVGAEIDAPRRCREARLLAPGEPIIAVAADALALEPPVRDQPRRRRAHMPGIDPQQRHDLGERAEPQAAAARNDRVAVKRDDPRPGTDAAGRLEAV